MIEDFVFEDLIPILYSTIPTPSKRKKTQTPDSDQPPTSILKQDSTPNPVVALFPSSPSGTPPRPSVQTPSILVFFLTIAYNVLFNGLRHSGPVPENAIFQTDESSEVFQDSHEELLKRWTAPHILTYPVEVEGVTRLSHLVLPDGTIGAILASEIPSSTLYSCPTHQNIMERMSSVSSSPLSLMANIFLPSSPSMLSTGAYSSQDISVNLSSLQNGQASLPLILPLTSTSECRTFVSKLSYLSVNGRKDPTNRARLTRISSSFEEATASTRYLSDTFLLWHHSPDILKAVAQHEPLIPFLQLPHDPPPSEPNLSQTTIAKLREKRLNPTYVSIATAPLTVHSDVATLTENLNYVNLAATLVTHITISTINIKIPIGKRLHLLRRSLPLYTSPLPDVNTGVKEPFPWFSNPTSMEPDSLLEVYSHGHRTGVVNVLSKPLSFGFDSQGQSPPLITSSRHVRIELNSNPTGLFHSDGYTIPTYPTLQCTAVPSYSADTLAADPPTILCHVRGFAENFDSQNLALPLILDNICQSTHLSPLDIFIVPTIIQAKHLKPLDKRRVLIEENVLTVFYNPLTVTTERSQQALQSLGLADSTQSILILCRGIPFELIAHPDTLLKHPVPLHTLEPINCILIPLAPHSCGRSLLNLLITSGAIEVSSLLHYAVLPANLHARFEYSHPRLYIFLTRSSQFKDTLAFGNPLIVPFLAPSLAGKKRSFKLDHLPGLYALSQPNGQWSRNRHLMLGIPRSLITQSSVIVTPITSSPINIPLTTAPAPEREMEASFNQLTVQDAFKQFAFQHAQSSIKQDKILVNSEEMILAVHALISHLKANAPGAGAVAEK